MLHILPYPAISSPRYHPVRSQGIMTCLPLSHLPATSQPHIPVSAFSKAVLNLMSSFNRISICFISISHLTTLQCSADGCDVDYNGPSGLWEHAKSAHQASHRGPCRELGCTRYKYSHEMLATHVSFDHNKTAGPPMPAPSPEMALLLVARSLSPGATGATIWTSIETLARAKRHAVSVAVAS